MVKCFGLSGVFSGLTPVRFSSSVHLIATLRSLLFLHHLVAFTTSAETHILGRKSSGNEPISTYSIHYTMVQVYKARNCTLAVHELVDFLILELPDSESTITEITGYRYFSLLRPSRELTYKSE